MTNFVQWYNHEHRHSVIGFVTAGQRHPGLDKTLLRNRTNVYEAGKRRCPQRWRALRAIGNPSKWFT